MLLNLFPNKKRKMLEKEVIEMLQALGEKIQTITLNEEKEKLKHEKQKLHAKFYATPLEEAKAAVDELNSRVDRYIRIEQDKDYSNIREHLARKDIGSEAEIVEICDALDREIVFKYVQVGKIKIKEEIINNTLKELTSVEQKLEDARNVVSEENDAIVLKVHWNYILQEKQDKLTNLKNICNNLKIRISSLKIDELNPIKQEVLDLEDNLASLEKCGRDYLSKQSLEIYTNNIKDYVLSSNDRSPEGINKKLNEYIGTKLKDCIGNEEKERTIKIYMVRLIYNRLSNVLEET